MTRLHHVKKSRRAWPKQGIKKGQEYFWWAFKGNGKGPKVIHRSATKPRPSQLERSEFLRVILEAKEAVEDAGDNREALLEALEAARDSIEPLEEECAEKAEAMRERFPNGCPTIELLEQRADACERIVCDIDIAIDALQLAQDDATLDIDWAVE